MVTNRPPTARASRQGGENVAADIVDDHVDALLADRPRDRRTKPLAAGDDPGIEPECLEPSKLLRRARGADHLGAEIFRQLQCRDPDAAGCRRHQHRFRGMKLANGSGS